MQMERQVNLLSRRDYSLIEIPPYGNGKLTYVARRVFKDVEKIVLEKCKKVERILEIANCGGDLYIWYLSGVLWEGDFISYFADRFLFVVSDLLLNESEQEEVNRLLFNGAGTLRYIDLSDHEKEIVERIVERYTRRYPVRYAFKIEGMRVTRFSYYFHGFISIRSKGGSVRERFGVEISYSEEEQMLPANIRHELLKMIYPITI